MPLPNPWKTPSAPSSPPSLRRKTSLRHRSKARLGLIVLIIVLTMCALDELRCMYYGCISRVGFYGGNVDRVGGATLPEDWKYRLGEQLKMNMKEQAQVEVESAPLRGTVQGKDKANGKEDGEDKENGVLVEPVTSTPTIDQDVHHAGDSERWIDPPPVPASPDQNIKEKIQADRQTYVDGEDIESPPAKLREPPTEASEQLATPSPGVQVAAEDLRAATSGQSSGLKPDAAKQEDVPEPPKLDKTKEKVDSVIAQKTVPKASSSAVSRTEPSSPPASKEGSTREDPKSHPKSQPHTHALGTNANNFGSMEMGALMGGR